MELLANSLHVTWTTHSNDVIIATRVVHFAESDSVQRSSETLAPDVTSFVIADVSSEEVYTVCVEVLFNTSMGGEHDEVEWDTTVRRSCIETSRAAANMDPQQPEHDEKDRTLLYIIVAVVSASAATLVLLFVCCLLLWQRRQPDASQRRQQMMSSNTSLLDSALTSTGDDVSTGTAKQQVRMRKSSKDSLDDVIDDAQRSSMVERSTIAIMTMPPTMRSFAKAELQKAKDVE